MTLYVTESGPAGGPLVVLVHGAMDRSAGFAKVARRLENVRVVRYDRRGYGRSRPHPGPFDIDAQVEDLLAIMAGRAAVVAGHSYGGNVALAAAQRRPGAVRAVVVYEAPLAWLDWWPNTTAGSRAMAASPGDDGDAAEAFLRLLIGDRRWERLPERTRLDRRAEGSALVGELTDLRQRAPWSPEAITVPVVVGRGTHARPHHVRSTGWVAAHIPGTEVIEIDGAHHGAHLSHPEQFAALVERAVARADGS